MVNETIVAVYVEANQSNKVNKSRPNIFISTAPENEAATAVKPAEATHITVITAKKRRILNLSINKFTNISKIDMVEVMVANVSNKINAYDQKRPPESC